MRRGSAIFLAWAALSRPAEAHIVGSRLGDFYAGALHPLTGLEDWVLWLVLGLLAGTQPIDRARWIVPVFPSGLLAGFGAGLASGPSAVALASSPVVSAGLMVLLGSVLAGAVRLPGPLLAVSAGAVAVVRGMANAGGVEPASNDALFAGGLALAGYAALTLVMAATEAFAGRGQGWRVITLRAAGSWVAAIGIMFGGFALRTG